jgi:hypothetical protein
MYIFVSVLNIGYLLVLNMCKCIDFKRLDIFIFAVQLQHRPKQRGTKRYIVDVSPVSTKIGFICLPQSRNNSKLCFIVYGSG